MYSRAMIPKFLFRITLIHSLNRYHAQWPLTDAWKFEKLLLHCIYYLFKSFLCSYYWAAELQNLFYADWLFPARSFSFWVKKEQGVGLSRRLPATDESQDSSKCVQLYRWDRSCPASSSSRARLSLNRSMRLFYQLWFTILLGGSLLY